MSANIYLLLYVDSPEASGAFYAGLLDRQPVEASPAFQLFVLDGGVKLGLWSRSAVEPAATMTGGGAELCFPVAAPAEVDARHAAWAGRGIAILQPPADLDFGRTFVARDPDGHRLRVFSPHLR